MMAYLVICIDSFSPAYLQHADTPTLDALVADGFYKEVQAMVPTVTNVNNVSIVTGAYPAQHGITGNYYRGRETGQSRYMETADFVLCETIFERVRRFGWRSALLTTKDKLRTLLETDPSLSISAESPPAWLVDRLGAPPGVYSLEVNHWLMAALREVMQREDAPELVYLSTTDYAMHKFAPEDEQSGWHLSRLDGLLGEALNAAQGEVTVAVTADHGMSAKSRALDLTRVLGRAGIRAEAIPIIKDRYVVHHQNLGGAAYVYLNDQHELPEAVDVLTERPGVEEVLGSDEAAARFHLHPERIGDLMVLATVDTVFGSLEAEETQVEGLRSHGSLHERTVPLIVYGSQLLADQMMENKDAMRVVEDAHVRAFR